MIDTRCPAALLAVVMAGSGLSGCATVASSYATDRAAPGASPVGLVYDLPIKTMSVSVGSNRFGLFVAVHDVRVEGDASASYVLAYRPDSSAADTFDVAIDKNRQLLTTVKVEADSKAADALTALGKSAGQFAGVFETQRGGKTQIFAVSPFAYWPTAATTPAEAKEQVAELNTRINAMVADIVAVQGCAMRNESVLAADRRAATCRPGGGIAPGSVPPVKLTIDYAPFKSQITDVDCSVGLCTRHQSVAAMTLTTQGSHDFTRLPLPNGSAPVPLPLRRVAFTKATTEYTLEDGLVTKTAFAKGAELPAILASIGSLPGAFVGGVVDGVAQAGNFRKARTDAAASKTTAAEVKATAEAKAAAAAKPGADTGHNEASRLNLAEAAFEAGLEMIVYPLPQVAIDATPVPGTLSPAAAEPAAGETPPVTTGKTTKPGPLPTTAAEGTRK